MQFALELELFKDKKPANPSSVIKNATVSLYSEYPTMMVRLGKDVKDSEHLDENIKKAVSWLERNLKEDVRYSLSSKNRTRFVIETQNLAFAKILSHALNIMSLRYMPGVMYAAKDCFNVVQKDNKAVILSVPSNFLLSSSFLYFMEIAMPFERDKRLDYVKQVLYEEALKLAKTDKLENRYFSKSKFIMPSEASFTVRPLGFFESHHFEPMHERLRALKRYGKKYVIAIHMTSAVEEPKTVFNAPELFYPKRIGAYNVKRPTKRHILVAKYGLNAVGPGIFFAYIPKTWAKERVAEEIVAFIDKVEETIRQNQEVSLFMDLEDKSYEAYKEVFSLYANGEENALMIEER